MTLSQLLAHWRVPGDEVGQVEGMVLPQAQTELPPIERYADPAHLAAQSTRLNCCPLPKAHVPT